MDKRKLIGALLMILLLVAGGLAVKYISPMVKEHKQLSTSDSASFKGKITLALDNWIGYFPFRSARMAEILRSQGWVLKVDDDGADIPKRMERLKSGELNFAVSDVGSYVLKGYPNGYPAVIGAVIDESNGGDAILARKDKIPNLDALKGNLKARIAFTPDSPSHVLLKAASFHFAVPELNPAPGEPRRMETNGSSEALKALLAGTADVAVLWEPDVSRALANEGIVKLLGSEDTKGVVVDILLVNREFSQSKPELANMVLSAYFQVLKYYRDHPDELIKDVCKETGFDEAAAQSMLKGVSWVSLADNCEKWFGIATPGTHSEQGLVETIRTIVQIFMNSGDFKNDPIPNGDPYRLMQSKFLQDLYLQGIPSAVPSIGKNINSKNVNSLEAKFSPLDEDGWKKLREVGTLKVAPIAFQQGSSELDYAAKLVVDEAAENLKHYPNFRLIVRGHTSTIGDAEENLRLSQERAESVARYLQVVYNVDPNRLLAIGYGGSMPLPKMQGESKRSWEYRLPRVELVLKRDVY